MSGRLTQICKKVYDNYLSKIEYNASHLNELVVRIMAEIGKLGGMTGEERKNMAIRTLEYFLDNSYINVDDAAKEAFKEALPSLIDTIYQIHKGTLFKDIKWGKVKERVANEIEDILAHLKEHFQFDGELDYADVTRVVSYVVEMVKRYKYLDNVERKTIVLNVIDEYLENFNVPFDREAISNLIELLLQVGKGKFTITGLSFIKKFLKFLKCA